MSFSCDHLSFSKFDRPFFPIICDQRECVNLEGFNAATLFLDCTLSSDLNWKGIKEKASHFIQKGCSLFWDLDFGIRDESSCLQDSMHLSSFLLAIQSFIEELYLPFQEKTLGVNLYRGPLILPLNWNFELKEGFNAWVEDYPSLPFPEKFYSVELLSAYLHRLAAALPDEALPFALFESEKSLSPALFAQLLSRELLPHLYVGFEDSLVPHGVLRWKKGKTREGYIGEEPQQALNEVVKMGVVLPIASHCTHESLELVDACIAGLEKEKIPFRLVFESHLTESWDQLDELIVFSDFLSSQGKRKIQGFEAAGGKIRGRGI